MTHLDPDRLLLLALDEPPEDEADAGHLASCPACREEVAATRQVASLARASREVASLPSPPSHVWERIAAGTLTSRPQAAPAGRPRARRPRWFGRRLAALAAACLILAGVGTFAIVRILQRDPAIVIAQADLVAQAGAPAGAHGMAQLIDTGDGLQLRVRLAGLPPVPGYYTVWIYDGRDVMIPLGSPGPAPLNLPAVARDVQTFRIVDVSAQNLGQQEHGRSVLQGSLHG